MDELKQKYAEKEEAFKQKYADVINELAVKYGKDLGVGYDMLKAIARAKKENLEPMYEADIEYNLDEVVTDYTELETLSKEIHGEA